MRRRLLVVVAVIAVVGVSAAAYFRRGAADSEPALSTVTVSRGAVIDSVEATGKLQAVTTVDVGTQVSGTIKALYADYNTRVRKGQVIAQLEPSLFETQVEQTRATLQRLGADVESARVQVEDTQMKLRRAQELSARALIPAADLETAQANARQALAALKAAEAQLVQGRAALRNNEVNLGHTTIRAPIDGIVISRSVDVGQTVAASMSAPTLFVIAQDLRQMQVNASVDESDIGRIVPGQRVRFSVDAYPDETFSGVVRQVRLEPVIEQNVVSYVTVIDVPNPELKLKPGMTANVTIEIARADNVLRVPNAALRFRPTAEMFAALGEPAPDRAGSFPSGTAAASDPRLRQRPPGAVVWTLTDGRLRRVTVEPGITDGTITAVAGGNLQEGITVVTGTGAPAAPSGGRSGSPLLPQRPRFRSTAASPGGAR